MDVAGLQELSFESVLFSTSPVDDLDMSKLSASPRSGSGFANDDAASSITVNTKTPTPQQPPSKTDKPRPHLCTTCQRCFARLEHLKRHERSHTKEKPFACNTCERCFARRDLLLRHQQKLHRSTTPAARPRNRRESAPQRLPVRARQSSVLSANGSGSAASALSPGGGGVAGMNAANGLNGASNGYSGLNEFSGLNGINTMTGFNGLGGVGGLGGLSAYSGYGGLGGGTMRPRAMTVSHTDATPVNPLSPGGAPQGAHGIPPGVHSRHPSLVGLPMHGMEQIPMQAPAFVSTSAVGHRGMSHGLPKLETTSVSHVEFAGGMHTAPPLSLFDHDFDLNAPDFSDATGGSTINPNALHYTGTPPALAPDASATFSHRSSTFHDMHDLPNTGDSLNWLSSFRHHVTPGGLDEEAIDTSSPSVFSTDSPGGISDIMLDGSTHLGHMGSSGQQPHLSAASFIGSTANNAAPASMWPPDGTIAPQQMTADNGFSFDAASNSFSDLLANLPLSPSANALTSSLAPAPAQSLVGDNTASINTTGINMDLYFSTPPPSLSSFSPTMPAAINGAALALGTNGTNGTATPETPASMNSSNGGTGASCNGPLSTITDATRTAIVTALSSVGSHSSTLSMRKFSFNAPASPASNDMSAYDHPVPSTSDLRRYIGAYFRHFHPHFPFLHVATMSFEIAPNPHYGNRTSGSVPSNGSLLLSMAAIGALYESEHDRSRGLFNMAKRMIQLYLDERRKANVRQPGLQRPAANESTNLRGPRRQQQQDNASDTPVWLVQAMLLNVMYGHNSSDKRAGEIAYTHCAALVSLAHGAELLELTRVEPLSDDADMSDKIDLTNLWTVEDTSASTRAAREEKLWLRWKAMEERKRTLYSIFVLSSLLVASYNHTPALTNSEILLDLPCDEEFYAAPNCAAFMAKGGVAAANHNRVSFHEVLGGLLRASEKQSRRNANGIPASVARSEANEASGEPVPSTFGCFILINALHNYIWETRQRHHNKVWTNEETEKMHRHIEPALEAWRRAWARNPRHATESPHSQGLTGYSLSTGALPMLDLAYVRLFVNLAPSKEKFWQRNWDGLAEELSRDSDKVQRTEQPPASRGDSALADASQNLTGDGSPLVIDPPAAPMTSSSPHAGAATAQVPQPKPDGSSHATSRREKHLRKAAFFAADALSAPEKLGLTMADISSRELPLQSALCALDCAQVLAEWVATLQDRVGPYLGILGHDNVELGQVPAIMLLEDEDVKLLGKIEKILHLAETTWKSEPSDNGRSSNTQMEQQIGYAAKVLSVTAYVLGKAAVWPVTHLMAECLANHAGHMRARAEKSVQSNSR